MRTSGTGRADDRRRAGFTLVELLIVLTIVGLMSAVVVMAIPDPRGSLVGEAERFAARAKAAQDRAVIDARGMSIRVTPGGYGFDRREQDGWAPLNRKPFTDYAWVEGTSASTGQQETTRIVFDSTGAADPAQLTLTRDDEQVGVTVGHDGRIDVVR